MRNFTPVQNTILPLFAIFGYPADVVAKSTTERGNSNLLSANNRTLIRAFFIRSTSTSKENTFPKNRVRTFLSMIACNGQRLIVGCLPIVTVFHPVTSYRPITVESEVIAPIKQLSELLAMIYKFLCLDREATDFHTQVLTINATNEENARFSLTARWRLLATIAKNLPDNQPIAFTSVMEVANV